MPTDASRQARDGGQVPSPPARSQAESRAGLEWPWGRRRPARLAGELRRLEDLRALETRGRRWQSVALVQIERFADAEGIGQAQHRQVASRLSEHVVEGRAFRLDGHTFAVVYERPAGDLVPKLEILRREVNTSLRSGSVVVGAASLLPGGGVLDAFARADAALRDARQRGGSSVVCHVADGVTPMTVEHAEAVRAIAAGGSVAVAYQPVISLEDAAILGYEALMRPEPSTALSPGQVFEVGARIGLVAELDEACRRAVVADTPGYDMPPHALLFLNVNAEAFVHPSFEPHRFAAELRDAALASKRVVLEITDDARVDTRLLEAKAANVRRAGFHLALDDVGGGAASMRTLRLVPVDYVKLDPEIVAGARADHRTLAALTSVCAFANEVGSSVIAEGIEDADMLAFVKGLGTSDREELRIHAAQGYHLGRPAPQPWRSTAVTPGA